MADRYGTDALAGLSTTRSASRATTVEAEHGMVLEDVASGWCGAVVRVEKSGGMLVVYLEDRRERVRGFPTGAGFLLDGRPVVVTGPVGAARRAAASARAAAARTASGSRAVPDAPARRAAQSRIFVEGAHDAELVEKVWGDDLRLEGVVVEMLGGVDDLTGAIRVFQPGPGRRMGVLVDHLVPGTKEQRIVEGAVGIPQYAGHLLVLGHPFVDVWQSVRPQRLGLRSWPEIPRGTAWKQGICEHLGWPAASPADLAQAWRRILGAVRTYADLAPALLASVEELIDFVTEPGH